MVSSMSQRGWEKAESSSYMEFRSVSWSGTCQLLWIMMRSRSPAKEWVLFIVWASEQWARRERQEHCETISLKHLRIKVYLDKIFWILERTKVEKFSPVLLVCPASERGIVKCADWCPSSLLASRAASWSPLDLLSLIWWSCRALSQVTPPVTETSAYPLLLSTH